MSAMLLYIITNAVMFSFILTNENIPQSLADWMLAQGLGPIAFLLAAGNFMEPTSIVVIFAPILFPVAELTVMVWPWLLAMLGFLMVVIYWPGLSIWFPHWLGMM